MPSSPRILIPAFIFAAVVAAPSHSLLAQEATQGPAPVAMVTPPPAKGLIAEALIVAKQKHKGVLVEFGASWCGPCRRFERFLADPVAGKIMRDNFEVVSLVTMESPEKKALENPGAAMVFKEMGGNGGIPFFYFLDEDGTKLGDNNALGPNNDLIGHPDTPEEVLAFDAVLRKVAPKLTDAERTTIHDFLMKMGEETRAKQAEAMEAAKKAAADKAAKAAADAKAKAAGGGGGGGGR